MMSMDINDDYNSDNDIGNIPNFRPFWLAKS